MFDEKLADVETDASAVRVLICLYIFRLKVVEKCVYFFLVHSAAVVSHFNRESHICVLIRFTLL